MVSIASLWLPILLSAVATFIASAVAWTMLPHHRSDFDRLPDEDALMAALRAQEPGRGVYVFPHATHAESRDPAYQEKLKAGPFGTLRIISTGGSTGMGKQLGSSFVFYIVVSLFAAYLASRTLAPGADYRSVFRVTGTLVFVAHAMAHYTDVIWFGQKWSNAFKCSADALVYAMLTGGVFGWLWPA
jgi:hypothetical protein